MEASSIPGRVLPFFIILRIGFLNTCIVTGVLLGGSMFLMFGASKVVFIVLNAIIYGFLGGMCKSRTL